MSKRPFVIFGIFALIAAVGAPFLAFQKEGSADAALVDVADHDKDGKQLFQDNCGTCHTLAAGGTDGVVGPNLDDTLAPSGQGNYEGTYARVLNAITCGFGGGRMPAGILAGETAKEAAAFVAAYAGQLSDDADPLVDTRTAPKPDPQPCAGGASEAIAGASESGS